MEKGGKEKEKKKRSKKRERQSHTQQDKGHKITQHTERKTVRTSGRK